MAVMVNQYFMSRVVRILYEKQVGSAFCVNFGGTQTLVTAKHLIKGLQVGDQIKLRHDGSWQPFEVEKFLACPKGFDVSVASLKNFPGDGLSENELDAEVFVGQEATFCGFPLGMEMRDLPESNGWPTCLIKSAMLGGFKQTKAGHIYLFDAMNNVGFSGGPVVINNNGKLKVTAVVCAYEFDKPIPVQKKSGEKFVDSQDYFVRPNSGFMMAIPIKYVIEVANLMLES